MRTDSSGNLYLLLNQGDGIRILKTDNAGAAVLAQAYLGAAGDIGIALALDPAGNVYVAGTTTSTTLTGTSGAAISNRTDTSTNSFVAKFDASLNSLFVTFTGGSRIAAAALSATSDAVFVTGITYAANLPVTTNGIQQAPAYGSSQNGFVEKFSSSGATLLYATYLTGASGDTTPAAIVADSSDNAYVAGATSASGFPTISALVPAMLSNPSGFLTKLTPAGDGITFSTFVPGPGLSSIAIDSTAQILLVSGSVALGQFPIDTVAMPLVPVTYQILLRIPLNGASVQGATLLAPSTQSFVAAGGNGDAWVDGLLIGPLLPLSPLSSFGNGFAAHITSAGVVDQTARLGGLPNQSPTYASLPLAVAAIAVDPAAEALLAGAILPTASSSLLATETYDLPLRNSPTTAFPSTVAAAEVTAATCNGSLCAGSAAYLEKLNPGASAPALTFSANDLPFVVLRNLGSAEADSVQISSINARVNSNCPTILYAGGECDILLSGGAAGSLTVSSTTASSQTISFPAYSATAPTSTIAYFPKELDFGIQSSASPAGTRTITVSNLGATSQTFISALDATANPKVVVTSPFGETASDCTLSGAATTKVLAAGATCHITLGLTAYAASASDGFLSADWSIGSRDVHLTGYSQAAALSVSASEIDFGTQYTNGIRLPRYLYLSNASTSPIAHTALALTSGSAFTLTDGCPASLLAASVCRIRIDYLAASSTSTDSTLLALDQGLSVLITGQTLPPVTLGGATVNPNLTVTPTSSTFANAVPVTSASSKTQTVTIRNSGSSAFSLTLTLSGDYTDATSCGATLAGGQSCSAVVTFVPSQPGTRTGLLAVTAGSGTSPAYAALSGTGLAILPANNGILSSGSIATGEPVATFYKVSQPFSALTATTTGPFKAILIEDVGFGHGQPAPSSFVSNFTGTCKNCYLGIQFQPTTTGIQPGTLTLTSAEAGSPYILGLTGTGLPLAGLLMSPLNQDFGTSPIHSGSGVELFTVSNLNPLGTAIVLGAPALTGDFGLSATLPTGGVTCGGNLAYTASCLVQVAFAPTAVGSRTGSLTLSGSGVSATAVLTGIGTVDPGVAINPLSLTFNNIPGPYATAQTVTVGNTGTATISIGAPTAGTASFTAASNCANLIAGAICAITVTFAPASATVTDTLSIPVTTTTGSPRTTIYSIALSGAYTAANAGLQILPGTLQFGPFPVGAEDAARQYTINNLTPKSLTLNISVPRQFTLTTAPCGGLAPFASCAFSVAFLPLTNGDIPGTLSAEAIPSDGSATLSGIAYAEGYGTGAGALTVTGALIVNQVFNFGQVASGQTLAQAFTLANLNPVGSPAITVRRVSSGPPFLSTTTCSTALAVGQSCTVTVTYSPSNQVAAGTAYPVAINNVGSLTMESDAATSPDTINFTGQAGPLAVANPANPAPLATFTLSQSSLAFAATTVGNLSTPQTVTLSNTGTVTIHVGSVFSSADFSLQNGCAAVVVGASCQIVVTASPQTPGVHIASVEIANDSATSLEFISVIVTGSPSPLTLTPASLNFGSVMIGNSTTLPVQVTNTTSAAVIFQGVSAAGQYTTSGTCPALGGSLPANSTCTVQVTFKPLSAGTDSGTLSVSSSASTLPLTLPLTGIGTQSQLVFTPSSLAFGSIATGAPAILSVTLQNAGTAPVNNLALTIGGPFAVTTPCPATTLAPLASCVVQVTFTPVNLGAFTGTLTITSSDPGSPALVPLSGTGVQGGSFTLTVNGGATASVSVASGQPATYPLAVTPGGGFSGAVALTCTPIAVGPDASCSLLPPSLTLAGTPQNSVATINTITSAGGNGMVRPPVRALQTTFVCLLLPGLLTLWRGRRRLGQRIPLLLAMLLSGGLVGSLGCGNGGGGSDPALRYTPAGTYQYQVTASSTSGNPISQTVTLNLTVTSR